METPTTCPEEGGWIDVGYHQEAKQAVKVRCEMLSSDSREKQRELVVNVSRTSEIKFSNMW